MGSLCVSPYPFHSAPPSPCFSYRWMSQGFSYYSMHWLSKVMFLDRVKNIYILIFVFLKFPCIFFLLTALKHSAHLSLQLSECLQWRQKFLAELTEQFFPNFEFWWVHWRLLAKTVRWFVNNYWFRKADNGK